MLFRSAITLRVEDLEKERALAIERCRATVEDHLAIGNTRSELANTKGEAGGKRALTQRDQLGGRMQQLAQRSSDDASVAHAEQRLSCAVEVRYDERFVEDDQRSGQALEKSIGGQCTPRFACDSQRSRRAGQPPFGGRGARMSEFGF